LYRKEIVLLKTKTRDPFHIVINFMDGRIRSRKGENSILTLLYHTYSLNYWQTWWIRCDH